MFGTEAKFFADVQVMKMDADSLYEESRGRMTGMSHRSLLLAIRYGLADWQKGVNVGRMLAVIESGDVWKMRGVGKKTVREWCKYVAQIVAKTPPQPPKLETTENEPVQSVYWPPAVEVRPRNL